MKDMTLDRKEKRYYSVNQAETDGKGWTNFICISGFLMLPINIKEKNPYACTEISYICKRPIFVTIRSLVLFVKG